MKVTEKIALAISQMEEATDFAVIAEMKAAMNSVYGDERNQIVKPTVDAIIKSWDKRGVTGSYTDRILSYTEAEIVTFLSNFTDVFYYQAIIHFPEIVITDGPRHHTIKDIYVRFAIKPSGKIIPSISGLRTTVTESEYLSQYLHSHLHRLNPLNIEFTAFCTGVGEINQIMALLNTEYKYANFMMFLMHIRNFLEWESREGTPYMMIESIGKRGSRLSGSVHSSAYIIGKVVNELIKSIGSKLRPEEFMKMFSFTASEKEIGVKASLEAQKWMALEIETWDLGRITGFTNALSQLLAIREPNGSYCSVETNTSAVQPYEGVILNFKGREIRFQIIDKLETKKHETYTNPELTKEVCKELSRLLTKTAITTPGIRSGSSLVYNSGATKSDSVLM